MNLHEIQEEVLAGIQNPNDIPRCVVSSRWLSSEDRMKIYRESIESQKILALEANFPICLQIVGQRCFYSVAHYYQRHYACNGNLNFIGEMFADCVATLDRLVGQVPYLPDIARLEYAVNQAFYAEEEEYSTALREQDPEKIYLVLPKSASLISSPYPFYDIWDVNRKSNDPEPMHLESERQYVLVWRYEDDVMVEKISRGEFGFYQAAKAGKNLNALCECLVGEMEVEEVSVFLKEAFLQGKCMHRDIKEIL